MSKNKPSRPDSMLIEPAHIVSAREDIGERGFSESLEELSQREPALAGYIEAGMASLAGRLALSGAPTPVVHGIYQEALGMVLSSLEAQRRGHYELWKDTIIGTRIEKLNLPAEPPAQKKTRYRRKKKGEE